MGPDQCLGKDVAVEDHAVLRTPRPTLSHTPDPSHYQRILAFLTSSLHIFTPTVFVAFVHFWHVLRSAMLHFVLRDHFIQTN